MNYKIQSVVDPQILLDPDTYCPIKSMNIKLGLIYEAQFDGHWSEEYAQKHTQEVIEGIMNELRQKVECFVKEIEG